MKDFHLVKPSDVVISWMYLSTAGKRHFSDIIETSRSILIEVYFLLHLMNEAKSKVTPKALENNFKRNL